MTVKRMKLKVNPKTLLKINKPELNLDDEINIFEMGTLLQFETHSWQARKNLPKKIAAVLTPKAEKEWVRATKSLIDRSYLQDINSAISEARAFVWEVSLPFPIKGIHFIPAENVDLIRDILEGYISKLKKSVNEFAKQYKKYIKEAEQELGIYKYFDPNDYPSDIRSRFNISYRFFDLTIPTHISKEMRNEEVNKFKGLMKETREMGILALREGFSEIVTHLTDTLTGKLDGEKKRLNQKAIDKVEEFFTSFQNKNIFHDSELEGIIEKAKTIVDGITPEDLRNDIDLTQIVNKQLSEVKGELDKSIETFKRKVSFI